MDSRFTKSPGNPGRCMRPRPNQWFHLDNRQPLGWVGKPARLLTTTNWMETTDNQGDMGTRDIWRVKSPENSQSDIDIEEEFIPAVEVQRVVFQGHLYVNTSSTCMARLRGREPSLYHTF